MEKREVFNTVWYLPEENRWSSKNILAFRDTGILIIGERTLTYEGKKQNVQIMNIQGVFYGKQGRDFINRWVKVTYDEGKTAFFADGGNWGWGGIFGGTKRIFQAVQRLQDSDPSPGTAETTAS